VRLNWSKALSVLTELSLVNFKAFSALTLGMRPLTVLTGLNSSGKSSVVQAILLTELARASHSSVQLNGPYGLSLGEASDVLNYEATSSEIQIAVSGDGWSDRFAFDVPTERAVSLPLRSAVGELRSHNLVGTYLSAERLGPRDLLEVDPQTHAALGDRTKDASKSDRLSVGHQGQYTPHVLAQYDRRQVREPLRHPGGKGDGQVPITLVPQTELWLSEIAGPVRVQARWLPGTNAATVRFRGSDTRTEWMRPANVGFGISYALPIVVGALVSDPRCVLIVENPEAHLHPAGQAAIGRFLALVAASGVQTIIETHSDHVVNGIRRAIAEHQKLSAHEVLIYFFSEGEPVPIRVQDTGSLTKWPRGFFDQAERDLTVLSRVTRSR
jgi:predicted ATPase